MPTKKNVETMVDSIANSIPTPKKKKEVAQTAPKMNRKQLRSFIQRVKHRVHFDKQFHLTDKRDIWEALKVATKPKHG